VAASYQREGLLPTEHPILDDNGDKEGSLDPGRQAKDGQSAAVLSLGSLRQQAAPANEKLRALYAERDAIERRIESLKLLKSGMDPAKYTQELEKLATDLALKTREIKAAEGGK
jgi:flagellar biosynthesis chaperone FliJ